MTKNSPKPLFKTTTEGVMFFVLFLAILCISTFMIFKTPNETASAPGGKEKPLNESLVNEGLKPPGKQEKIDEGPQNEDPADDKKQTHVKRSPISLPDLTALREKFVQCDPRATSVIQYRIGKTSTSWNELTIQKETSTTWVKQYPEQKRDDHADDLPRSFEEVLIADIQQDAELFADLDPEKIQDYEFKYVTEVDNQTLELFCDAKSTADITKLSLRIGSDWKLLKFECRIIKTIEIEHTDGTTTVFTPRIGKDQTPKSFLRSKGRINVKQSDTRADLCNTTIKNVSSAEGSLWLPTQGTADWSIGYYPPSSQLNEQPRGLRHALTYLDADPPRLEYEDSSTLPAEKLIPHDLERRIRSAQDELDGTMIGLERIGFINNSQDGGLTGLHVSPVAPDTEYYPISIGSETRRRSITFRPRVLRCKIAPRYGGSRQSKNLNRLLAKATIEIQYPEYFEVAPLVHRGDSYSVQIGLPNRHRLPNVSEILVTIGVPGYRDRSFPLSELSKWRDVPIEIKMVPLLQNVVILVPAAKPFKGAFELDKSGVPVQRVDGEGDVISAMQLIRNLVRVLHNGLKADLSREGLPQEVDLFAVLPDSLVPLDVEVNTPFENGGRWWAPILGGAPAGDSSSWSPYNSRHDYADRFGPNTLVVALLAGIPDVDPNENTYADTESRTIEHLHIVLLSHKNGFSHDRIADYCRNNSDSLIVAANPNSNDSILDAAEQSVKMIIDALKAKGSQPKSEKTP